MKIANKFALACLGALALATSVLTGCAADRPIRNGVPNEQLYLRKSFIIREGAAQGKDKPAVDDGWMLKATVMRTTTPNPLGQVLFTGAENNGMMLRFVATQDHLQLVNMREFSDSPQVAAQDTRTPEVVESWSAEHGDLKLRVTADGEKTNWFEVNQELDWHQRQWVHVNLARGDLSDFALFGSEVTSRLGKCAAGGGSATVVPDSIIVDEDNDYLEWTTSLTIPVNFADPACVESYGEAGDNFQRMGRQNVTVDLKYSMMRSKPLQAITYKPLELAEKDPIRRKYGPITQTTWARDPDTQQVAAREFAVRFDPQKDIVLYFAQGYPEEYKSFFNAPNGIVAQTNAIFEKAGAKTRLVVKNFDDFTGEEKVPDWLKKSGRQYGDVRYNFIRWMSDIDVGADFIGVEQFVPDPRTGEALSASVNIADFPLKEFVAQRVEAFLETIMCRASETKDDGSGELAEACGELTGNKEWGAPLAEITGADGKPAYQKMPDTCTPGQIAPLLPSKLADSYGHSSLFSKMQEYLGDTVEEHGHEGPRQFTAIQDEDFRSAYFKLVPYYLFADPDTNQFVKQPGDSGAFGGDDQYKALTKLADFHALAKKIDHGEQPFDMNQPGGFIDQALSFADAVQDGLQNRHDYDYKRQFIQRSTTKLDDANDVISFTGVMQKAGRHCIDGHWETKDEWMKNLETTYHALTVWHEFGHLLGMNHNFLASMDEPNYPKYTAQNCDPATDATKCNRVGMNSSSVMEYSATPDRIFWSNESGDPGWAPYDRGAISWLYANEGSLTPQQISDAATEATKHDPKTMWISGQLSPTMPWKDPEGFHADGTEIEFLYCNETHEKYSPFCRTDDFGSTPSEIIANELESYEWQYAWRNFRKYRKVWDLHNYADVPAKEIVELRRFLPMWKLDFNGDKLRDDFGRINIQGPADAVAREQYMKQLASKFDNEMSAANQMVAAFHLAVIQQSSGERPFATIIDKYFGDVTQQGIILDKVFAMRGWVGLWPSKNYDPNQDGITVSSFASVGDEQYQGIAQKAATSMLGEDPYDAYPYLKATAVTLFARDTQSLAFSSFAGTNIDMRDWIGSKVFANKRDMLTFFADKAVQAEALPELGCAAGPQLPAGTIPSINTCTYDPTIKRQKPEDLEYSDEFNEFVLDNHRYAWMLIKDRNQYVFVDRDRNTTFYRFIRTFNEEVTKKQDEANAYAYTTQIKYTVDAFHKYNDGNY